MGALIGQAGLKRKTGLAMPALIIGANIPDIDAACFFWLDGVEHLAFRRGITHGPPAMILLPLILAGMLRGFDRWQQSRGKRPEKRLPVSFGWLFALSLVGCLSHPALDWLNVYGVRLLEPFSSQWFYGDVLFIIDVWLWGLLGFATWWSLRQERKGGDWQRTGRQALAIALAYIGLNAAITYNNETVQGALLEPYPRVAIASPVPAAFWQRERIIQTEDGKWYSDSWAGPRLGALDYRAPESPRCAIPAQAAGLSADAAAFLFWSRAPFAERGEDGTVILRDARFYDPRARDRFSVVLPEGTTCRES